MKRTIALLMMIGLVVGVFNGFGYVIKTHTEKYDNGKMSGEANYIDGKEEGKVVSYYESGEIVDEDIYRDGKCIEDCEGNE